MTLSLSKRIRPGDLYPRMYGVAWMDYARNEAVCLPIPLNVVAHLVRWVLLWCKCPFVEAERARHKQMIDDAYKQGRSDTLLAIQTGEHQ